MAEQDIDAYAQISALLWAHVNFRDDEVSEAADAILGAGWRPPARVIETVEQLVADVPDRAIVLSAAGTIACRFDYGTGVVFGDDRPFPWTTLQLPAAVLWEPEVDRG